MDVKEGLGTDPLAGLYPSEYMEGKRPLSSISYGGLVHNHTEINTDPRPDIQLHRAR